MKYDIFVFQPTAEVHQYFFYTTFSQSVLVWYAVIGIEKLVLGIMSLVFAIRTRKVKMRGLDDSKFVIAATYATNLFSLPGIAGTLGSIGGYYNVFVAVLGGNLFVSTTTVLSLIFIPKVAENCNYYYTLISYIKIILFFRLLHCIRILLEKTLEGL